MKSIFEEFFDKLLPLIDLDIDSAFEMEKHQWIENVQLLLIEAKEKWDSQQEQATAIQQT